MQGISLNPAYMGAYGFNGFLWEYANNGMWCYYYYNNKDCNNFFIYNLLQVLKTSMTQIYVDIEYLTYLYLFTENYL